MRYLAALLVLICLGASQPALANCATPCTKAQITTDINTNWPDNTTGTITPALLRSTVTDLLNSYTDIVQSVVTGTTGPTQVTGNTVTMGTFIAPTLTITGQAYFYNTVAQGAILQGDGSSFDTCLMNKNAVVVACIPTGANTFQFPGSTSGAVTLTTSATAGHFTYASSSTPTLTAGCNGAGSVVSGSDAHGTITGQTAAATTCTLSFGTSYSAAPDCVVSGYSSPLTGVVTVSTASIVVNFTSTANYKWSYSCLGN